MLKHLRPRDPLFRLLLVNLGIGTAAAALLFGGLLALNPANLRQLILSDQSPEVALGLLLFGFLITFGSAAMGTAIMSIARRDAPPSGGTRIRDQQEPVPVRLLAKR